MVKGKWLHTRCQRRRCAAVPLQDGELLELEILGLNLDALGALHAVEAGEHGVQRRGEHHVAAAGAADDAVGGRQRRRRRVVHVVGVALLSLEHHRGLVSHQGLRRGHRRDVSRHEGHRPWLLDGGLGRRGAWPRVDGC